MLRHLLTHLNQWLYHSKKYSFTHFPLLSSSQLLDVGAAAQTPAAQRAMMDLVTFDQDSSIEYPERLLFASAYSTHPGEYLLEDLMVRMSLRCYCVAFKGVAIKRI